MAFVKDDGPCTKCQALIMRHFFFFRSIWKDLSWAPGMQVWYGVEKGIFSPLLPGMLRVWICWRWQMTVIVELLLVYNHIEFTGCWCLKSLYILLNNTYTTRVYVNILWTCSLSLDLYLVTLQMIKTVNFLVLATRPYQSKYPLFVQLFLKIFLSGKKSLSVILRTLVKIKEHIFLITKQF